MKKLSELIVMIAATQVGVEEKPRGSNRGPQVDEYQRASWLKEQDWDAWCATFLCWVIMKAMEEGRRQGAVYTFKRPRTAGAYDYERWSLEQDSSTATRRLPGMDIQSGDIVIFNHSHIGVATSKPNTNGYFDTIEGNTNADGSREGYAVLRRRRHISSIKTRIRFTC